MEQAKDRRNVLAAALGLGVFAALALYFAARPALEELRPEPDLPVAREEPSGEHAALSPQSADADPAQLRGGDRRDVDRALGAARTVAGRVRFAAGAARVADLHVLARTPAGELVARVPAAPDGSFELSAAIPAGGLFLDLEHRFAYVPRPVRIEPEDAAAEIVVPAELGAYLRVDLRSPDGSAADEQAVADAALVLRPSVVDPNVEGAARGERRATRGDRGGFEFTGVATGVRHDLSVACAGHPPLDIRSLRLEPLEERAMALQLETGCVLLSRAQDEHGQPIAGADVELRDAEADALAARATTGADGAAELRGLRRGAYRLLARKAGYLPAQLPTAVAAPGEAPTEVVVTLSSGASISGRVRWPDGRPAAGAEVRATTSASQGTMIVFRRIDRGSARADAAGEFRITGLDDGECEVEASIESTVDAATAGELPAGRAVLTGVRAGAADLDLVLEPALSLRGRVADAAGSPIARFELWASARVPAPGFAYPVRGRTFGHAFEHAGGEFALGGLWAGEWLVDLRANGWALVAARSCQLPQPAGELLELRLVRAASLAGSVVGPDGAPIAGARVLAASFEAETSLGGPLGDAVAPQTISDWRGRFELGDLPLGRIGLWAEAEGFAPSDRKLFGVEADERRRDLVLALRGGGTVRGSVYASGGLRAAGVSVQAGQFAETSSQLETRTDASGSFELRALAPGPWEIIAALPPDAGDGGAAGGDASPFANCAAISIELSEGQELEVTLGAPVRTPVMVRGTVLAAGQPGEFQLVFSPRERHRIGAQRHVATAADGAYAIELPQAGRYRVWVSPVAPTSDQARVPFDHAVPAVPEHRIDFELPLGTIRGRVVGPRATPLEGALLSLASASPSDGRRARTLTDAEGRYSFTHLGSGTYALMASAPDQGPWGQGGLGRALRADVALAEGETREGVDFELQAAGELEVLVRGPAGEAIAGARVVLRDASGASFSDQQVALTDADGRARIRTLAPGDYGVGARADELASDERTVSVTGGECARAELSLAPGAFVDVAVAGGEDAPPAEIRLLDARGWPIEANASGGGGSAAADAEDWPDATRRFGPLPPGQYTASASSAAGAVVAMDLTLGPGDHRNVSLTPPE